MSTSRRLRAPLVLTIIAIVFAILALPCVGLGVLGLLGVVADVGPGENRDIGWGFLRLALVPAGLGAIALVAALAVRRTACDGDDGTA